MTTEEAFNEGYIGDYVIKRNPDEVWELTLAGELLAKGTNLYTLIARIPHEKRSKAGKLQMEDILSLEK